MDIQVKIKLTRGMEVPVYATPGSAAVDLRAALDDGAEITLAPGARALIPTGLAVSPESTGYVAIIAGRSGLGIKNGVSLSNGIGVIDSDYRGEIQVGLINHGSEPFTVHRGDRIAQMFFLPVAHADLLVTDTLDETERSTGGFGHTGIR
ncbi:MAG: dUTP diphosphatase [Eubacteriales bacterium]|nr:dUTP diphosphatase [Eubacteriales bacterium]